MRLFFAFLLLTICFVSRSQCLTDLKKVLPGIELSTVEKFGSAIALSENFLVVAAVNSDTLVNNSGVVYVFAKSFADWTYQAMLSPSDGTDGMQFGYDVAIDSTETTILVVALSNGGLYSFNRNGSGWISGHETEKVALSDMPVSMDVNKTGTRLAVSTSDGKILIYDRPSQSSWNLNPPYSFPFSQGDFTPVIRLNKKYLALGLPGYGANKGAVYVYKDFGAATPDYHQVAILTSSIPSFTQVMAEKIQIADSLILASGRTYESGSLDEQIFVFSKPAIGEWTDANEDAHININGLENSIAMNFTPLNHNQIIANCLSYNINNKFIYNGSVQLITKGADWKNISHETLWYRPNIGYSSFGTDIKWNGQNLIFSITDNKNNPAIYNSVTSLTKSNGVWGDEMKVEVDRINNDFYNFGNCVLKTPNELLIGSFLSSVYSPGAVFIAGKDMNGNWVRTGKIVPPFSNPDDVIFGRSLAINKDELIVSATGFKNDPGGYNRANPQSGLLFVYKKSTPSWTSASYVETLKVPDSLVVTNLGLDIVMNDSVIFAAASISGNYGNYIYPYPQPSSGTFGLRSTLIVFEKEATGWTFKTHFDGFPISYGSNMSLYGDTLAVGDGSQVILLTKNLKTKNWEVSTIFKAPTFAKNLPSEIGSYFGYSVDLTADHLFVGIPWLINQGIRTGGVLAISKPTNSSWPVGEQTSGELILPNDKIENGIFGVSVKSKLNSLIVGAAGHDWNMNWTSPLKSGAAYIIQGNSYSWHNYTTLLKLQGEASLKNEIDEMGHSVDVDLDNYYVSATKENTPVGRESGAVYVIPTPPLVKLISPICQNSSPQQLFGYPFGGTWSGQGLVNGSNGLFDPNLVGVGKYLLSYKTPNCAYEGKLLIEVTPSPPASLASPNSISICQTNPQKISVNPVDSATYQWYYHPPNSNSLVAIAGQTNPDLMVGLSGNYHCMVAKSGCASTSPIVTVTYETPTTTIGPQPTICDINKTVSLMATPAGGKWSGKGVIDETGGVFSPSGLINGKYPVTYSFTSQSGCRYSLPDTVLVDTIPTITLKRLPGDYCISGIASIQSLPSMNSSKHFWMYMPNKQSAWLQIDTIDLAMRQFAESGYYQNIVTNSHCRAKSDSLLIGNLTDMPVTLQPADSLVEICIDTNFKLSVLSRDDATITWYQRDSADVSFVEIEKSKSITISTSGFYKANAELGFCQSESKPIYVKFLPKDSIWVPNVFTPNGDDLNPVFQIKGNVADYTLSVMNRWGNEVYGAKASDPPWDGGDHPTGTYFWFIELTDCKNEKMTYQGTVTILR